MNRCPPRRPYRRLPALLLWLSAGLLPALGLAQAPQRTPPIPPSAPRGVLQVTQPPDVLLDGQPARLSPGARIRDRNNLLALSATLVGQELPVRYVRDPLGLLHQVWILNEAELQATKEQ